MILDECRQSTTQRAQLDHLRQHSATRNRELENKLAMTQQLYQTKLENANRDHANEISTQEVRIARMEQMFEHFLDSQRKSNEDVQRSLERSQEDQKATFSLLHEHN